MMRETKTKNTTERRINSMKNKVLVLMGVLTLIFAAYGCSEKETKETTQEPKKQISYAAMIPNPEDYFKSGTIEVTDEDGGVMYAFSVHGFEQSEFEAYVDKCIEMGFDDANFNTDTGYGAYTSDGMYWVSVEINDPIDPDEIIVLCKVSSEYEDEYRD